MSELDILITLSINGKHVQLLESIRNLAYANKDWDKPTLPRLLKSAYMYAEACRERLGMIDPFGDNFWER